MSTTTYSLAGSATSPTAVNREIRLYATGLVAGGSIAGLIIVFIAQLELGLGHYGESLQESLGDPAGTLIAVGVFAALCGSLVRRALRNVES